MSPNDQQAACPCGSGRTYGDCCAPFHTGKAQAPTAEALMRSRYSAYVLEDEDYLLASWHASTRPVQLGLQQEPMAKWLGLKVLATGLGGTGDSKGTVEFIARYKVGGKAHRLHEVSRFVREGDQWFYVNGDMEGGEEPA